MLASRSEVAIKPKSVAPPEPIVSVPLTERERALLCEAIDSHNNWQLSDEADRRSGGVYAEGDDDDELQEAEALVRKLEGLRSKE